MVYQGSKEKIADEIVSILNTMRSPGQLYWEPFLGSASTFSRMATPRLGTDSMTDLIMLWNEVIADRFIEPSYIVKSQYDDYMKSDVPSAIRAYIGFFWSFSGMFNKGYSPDFFQGSRSFHSMHERAKSLRAQPTKISACDYTMPKVKGALIYADPPYRGTTGYKGAKPFDHDKFYLWCLEQKEQGNTVVVSEYFMPEPFQQIHEFPFRTSLATVHRDSDKPERLYTLL